MQLSTTSAGTFQYKCNNNVELNLQNKGCSDEALCCCFFQHQSILYAPQQQAVLLSFITEGSQLAPHLQLHQGIGPAALRRHVHQLQEATGTRMRKDLQLRHELETEKTGEVCKNSKVSRSGQMRGGRGD